MYIMGAYDGPVTGNWNYWTSLDDFPPFTSTAFYLGDSTLDAEPPTRLDYSQYTYDPSNPTPMIGGNNLPIPIFSKVKGCGTENQAKREARKDVLTFDSEPLTQDTPVVGNIRATLFVASSAKDTDFVVTVSDLNGKTSSLVRFGIQRMRWRDGEFNQSDALVAEQVYEIDVDLAYTAYVFPKGHKIRVSVASAAYPYYSANSNSGELDLVGNVKNVVAQNTVYFAPDRQSKLVLPIVDYKDIPKNSNFGSEAPQTTMV